VADVLARARQVLATAQPFDPSTSARRFTIGAPDGVSAVFLPQLLAGLRGTAPGVGIGIRQVLPRAGEPSPDKAWHNVFVELDERVTDIAVVPSDHLPARFHAALLYEEDFVVAVRAGHPFADDPSLDQYCAMRHLVVSLAGDPHGFVDELLASHGRSRHVALTVPNFMFALAVISDSDLVSALPRRFITMHGARFGVVGIEAPVPLTTFRLHAVTPKVAMMDMGLRWLFDLLVGAENAP
jgi:DNA-binding transcriptional LysR family regulator